VEPRVRKLQTGLDLKKQKQILKTNQILKTKQNHKPILHSKS
jgi:hypothetical protein